MIDVVVAEESSQEFIDMAQKLGIRSLYFLSKNIKLKESSSSALHKVISCVTSTNQIHGKKKTYFGECGDARSLLEHPHVSLIFNQELSSRKDPLYSRSSGLNQVLCAIAAKKNKIIALNFNLILNAKGAEQAKIIGRMKQNVRLCQKYKVHIIIASFATKPEELRSFSDLAAVASVLGYKGKVEDLFLH